MTDPTTSVAVPIAVKASAALWALGMGLGIVNLMADPIPGGSVGAMVVGAIIGVAIGAFLIYSIYRGRNWVRILVTVLVGLNTLFLLLDLITGAFGYTWLDLVGGVMSDVSVILLWLAASRQYFGAVKQARRMAAANEPEAPASRD